MIALEEPREVEVAREVEVVEALEVGVVLVEVLLAVVISRIKHGMKHRSCIANSSILTNQNDMAPAALFAHSFEVTTRRLPF